MQRGTIRKQNKIKAQKKKKNSVTALLKIKIIKDDWYTETGFEAKKEKNK